MDARDRALVALGEYLLAAHYRFVTITPESHRRVNARPENVEGRSLTDIFGWSRPFRRGALPPDAFALLVAADAVQVEGDMLASAIRFSTIDEAIFVHSRYPTVQADAVFFGPDTYRFVRFIQRAAPPSAKRIVDIGAGSGAGGILVARRAERTVLADINPDALRFAKVNAQLAGVEVECVQSDVLNQLTGEFGLVISNPPYLADVGHRVYRDGGGRLGIELSVRIAVEAVSRLAPGGELLLYTGSPVVGGEHPLLQALVAKCGARAVVVWEELDPDVFGEELETPTYREVDRIAAVGIRIRKNGTCA